MKFRILHPERITANETDYYTVVVAAPVRGIRGGTGSRVQLEALKARTSTWDKIAARLPRISGYVQTGYEWSETS